MIFYAIDKFGRRQFGEDGIQRLRHNLHASKHPGYSGCAWSVITYLVIPVLVAEKAWAP